MSMITQLAESAKTLSPNAYKVAALGHLNSLVASMYGFENITTKEATLITGTRFKMERDRVKTAMEAIDDCLSGMGPSFKVKIAEHALHPEGVLPEAWNFMRVEKVGKLLEIADLASRCGETKLAKEALAEHDRLAELAFDYFKDYTSKMSSAFADHLRWQGDEDGTKVATVLLDKTTNLAKDVFQKSKLREYGGTALKGLLGGGAAAAGAAPILSHVGKDVADDVLTNARDKALQAAAGTAGIAVGANQLNNLFNRVTTAEYVVEEECPKHDGGDGPGEPDEDKKRTTFEEEAEEELEQREEEQASPIAKMAFHFLLDQFLDDDGVRRQNKIACVHAIHEFVVAETPMFEKHANMFNPSQYQNQQGMSGAPVQTPQYPMGAGGTPMAGDSASAIGNAAAGGGNA